MPELQTLVVAVLAIALVVVVLNKLLRSRVLWFAAGGVVTYLYLENPAFDFQPINILHRGIKLIRDLNLLDLLHRFV